MVGLSGGWWRERSRRWEIADALQNGVDGGEVVVAVRVV
jgi:hypothetical protein